MHIICIPLLVWTYAFFLTYIPFEYSLNSESFYLKPLVFNYTSIVSLFYIIYYLYLDYNIGKKWIPIFLFICYTTKLYKILYPETALYNCIIVHIGSWIVQLLSHKFFEGNKPNDCTIRHLQLQHPRHSKLAGKLDAERRYTSE